MPEMDKPPTLQISLPLLPSPNSGLFQTITINRDSSSPSQSKTTAPKITSLTIVDALYGTHTLTSQDEPVLLALLQSPHLTRLAGVHQHGITGLLDLTPKITRLEHSIGVFLVVRSLGASLAEQVAALLHDVSHTALSHVVDFALTSPGQESYHEAHKSRYLSQTDLPQIVSLYADDLYFTQPAPKPQGDDPMSMSVFNEHLHPLLEQPAPHLCADRIDYALRDAVAFAKLSISEAQEIFASLKVYSSPRSGRHPSSSQARNRDRSDRRIIMSSTPLALKFAKTYKQLDHDVWSNPANIGMYTSAGNLIRQAIQSGRLERDDLWRLSDQDFWEVLRSVTDDIGRDVMTRLEQEGLRHVEGMRVGLPRGTKIRTLDPDVLAGSDSLEGQWTSYKPLSVVLPAWGLERDEYINQRKGLIESGAYGK